LAENILHDFEAQVPDGVTIVPGSGGVFEVSVGEKLVFSKKQLNRFPEENEAEELVGKALGA
jgi:selenoprotein W-related protein